MSVGYWRDGFWQAGRQGGEDRDKRDGCDTRRDLDPREADAA